MILSAQSIEDEIKSKQCTKCKEFKSIDNFNKDRIRKDGLSNTCKVCSLKRQREYDASGRNRYLTYGITIEKQKEIFEKQNGECGICTKKLDFQKAHLDHVEHTNPIEIRGFLCSNCNLGLGHFQHNKQLLLKTTKWLDKSTVFGDKNNIPRIYSKQRNNSSGYLGVIKVNNKWRAQIFLNKKNLYLGMFDYPEQAALAYDDFIRENYPKGSTIKNIPIDWKPAPLNLNF